MTAPLPLALRLPLAGRQLIEASAGTGKTYTLAMLYLRLVLGHLRAGAALSTPRLPPQILVATFTEAAAQELRERIRRRLSEAQAAFGSAAGAIDPQLAQLRAELPTGAWPDCARRLEWAVQWLDEAAIHTIHGWCQRMLREHALGRGQLFEQQLQSDLSAPLEEAVNDYWRSFCYPLTGAALDWVYQEWQTPRELAKKIRPLWSDPEPVPSDSLAARHAAALAARQTQLAVLKRPWRQWAAELRELCEQGYREQRVDKRKLRPQYYQPWFDKLSAWARDPTLESLELGSGFKRLTPAGLAEAWTQGAPPAHPALAAMLDLPAALTALPAIAPPLLRHAAAWVRARFEEDCQRRAEVGFDALLTQLDAALQDPAHGPALAAAIRRQFPLALIDEFQDTDSLQYRIFSTIYPPARDEADPEQAGGLLLIGDPKQAIYTFRGADIHAYIAARREHADRRWRLDTNYRSSTAMVAAVNRLFERAEQRPQGAGAFLFRHRQSNPLPFFPAQAHGLPVRWQLDGRTLPALSVWQLASEAPLSAGSYQPQLAAACASAIVRLLGQGAAGRAGFASDDAFKALDAGDIAILVRDRKEAAVIRQALQQRSVASVFLSSQDSVFASTEAPCLLAWLQACANPEDEARLRSALASPSLGLELAALTALFADEAAWEREMLRFRDYRSRWREQGVLPMLYHLLHDFQVPARLLARPEGERRLTNLLHLAELLQQAAVGLNGEQALIHYLSAACSETSAAAEAAILRLESDAARVKIVTIHKAKGLEYPLVFLPFACFLHPVNEKQPLRYHDAEGRPRLSLQPTAEDLYHAERERLAEDLRLLYVALTRARHACWIGVADIRYGAAPESRFHDTALGYLLTGGTALASPAMLAPQLQELAAHTPSIAIQPLPEIDAQRLPAPSAVPSSLQARQLPRPIPAAWRITSYSGLQRHEMPDQEALADAKSGDPAATAAGRGALHRFPRGAEAGTFLHGLLEWLGEEGFAQLAAAPKRIAATVASRCQRQGWEDWADTVRNWLQRLLSLPLPLAPNPLALRDLRVYQTEMEFWLSAHQVDLQQLERLILEHSHAGQPRPAIQEGHLDGYLRGYVDLVFEHQGRYYLLDYKSNWLGPDAAAYTPQAMEAAVLAKRYDLQSLLYLLALHRQLAARLPDYDYRRHMGGALFWFLRGADSAGHGVYASCPPPALIEALDRLFQGGPQARRQRP